MLILAIDPGLTTGACMIATTADGFRVVSVEEIPWNQRFSRLTALVQNMQEPSIIGLPSQSVAFVIESFRLRQGRAFEQSGSDFPSCQVIGIFEYLLWSRSVLHLLKKQEPGAMSRVQVLPEHEQHVLGSEHRKDAYKHARYFYVTNLLNRIQGDTQ